MVGDPVESNIVLAGVDMVSVDAVGSAVMGLDLGTIRHVQQAAMRGLGVAGLDRITVLGEPIEAVVKKFSTAYSERKLKTYGLANPLSEEDIVYMRNRFAKRIP